MPKSPAKKATARQAKALKVTVSRDGARNDPPSKKAQQSQETRERILDAAEELFSMHGFYGVAIREVSTHAALDTSLVHYHFGSKQGLFDAVLFRRADVINALRMESMDAYDRESKGRVTVEGAVESFLVPLLELLESGGKGWRSYFALIGQVSNSSTWGGQIMSRHFDPVVKRLIELLRKALPDAPAAEFYWSYHFFVGALMLSLANTGRIEPLSGQTVKSSNVKALSPRLVAFAAAGIRKLCAGQR